MKFAIWGFQANRDVSEVVLEIVSFLQDGAHQVAMLDSFAMGLGIMNPEVTLYAAEELPHEVDCILSIGGDGTLLAAAQSAMKRPIPILGVNLGKLGFLTGLEREWRTGLEQFINGHYHVQERMVLNCRMTHKDGEEETFWALNELVVERADRFNLLSLKVHVDETYMNTYKADGLIVSTPTGSTAYALSAGGPILDPGLDALLITPISAHTLSVRPVVLPPAATVKIQLADPDARASVHVDGKSTRTIRGTDRVTIRMSTYRIQLVIMAQNSFYETLRKKFHWGRRFA